MATPIGHALAGYSIYLAGTSRKSDRNILFWFCLLTAIAPDLDFIPGILQGQPNLYHQGLSHSLGAGLLASFAAALIVNKGALWKKWSLFFVAYASHLTLDFFAPDGRPPYGQPLFWPISNEYYFAPPGLQLLWGVHHAKATSAATTEWLSGILHLHNLAAIGIEVLVTLPLVLLARCVSSLKSRCTQKDFQQKHEGTA
jgi:inner membrane protein